MIYLLRLWLAQTLVHQFEGLTARDWLDVLRREQYRISPVCWPRAAWISAMSLGNSVAARAVVRRHGAAIKATRVEAPVFVLGHFRSGTTLLYDLLATDRRFAVPTRYQTFNPRTFLATERWLAPLVEPFMLPRDVQEDEIAYLSLTRLSPYMDWVFPRSRAGGYGRYLTFRDATPAEANAWQAALTYFLQALTLRHGRPLVLKSPPHTGRVRLILDAFPDARFVHIRRDPYAVFASTLRLLHAVRPVFRLQLAGRRDDVAYVLRTYRAMYDAYLADREHVPPGQLVEIAYEDLERSPVDQLRAIYQGLGLGDFEPARAAVEDHLRSLSGHRKGSYPRIDAATRARIAADWSPVFDAWGYAK